MIRANEKKQVGKEEEKKAEKFCKDCRFYDKSSERLFHRLVGKKDEKGQRTLIIETRAMCRGPKAKARGHLVMAECTRRQCP